MSLQFWMIVCLFSMPWTARASIVDLHSHLAAHLPYGFMLKGGTPDDQPPALEGFTHEHKFHQHLYRDWLKKSGIQIHLMAALPNIFAFSRDKAWDQIEQQLRYVEDFVARYKDEFALAKTPAQARQALAEGKVVLIHAIEGGEHLLDSQEDAYHWAKRGVAMIGPIHLIDIDYGDSCVMEGRKMLNWKGAVRRGWFGGEDRGLSEKGKAALKFMLKAGLIIDTAHMSPKSLSDSLDLTAAAKVGVTLSHGYFYDVRKEERGISVQTYQRLVSQGGLFGLTLGGFTLYPLGSEGSATCPLGSVADFERHTQVVAQALGPQAVMALGSDSNGFVDHLAPCLENPGKLGVWATGLRTPMDYAGLTQQVGQSHFANSGERFLELWEQVLAQAPNL